MALQLRSVAFVVAGSLALLPGSAVAVTLAGRWHVQVSDAPSQVVEISQTGNTVSIPLSVGGLTGGQLTGTITGPVEFELSGMGYPCPALQPTLRGHLLPDENTADALFVSPCLEGYFSKRLLFTRCTCDDANSADGDGCDATCQVEPCFTCSGDPSVCTPTPEGGSCDDRRDCTVGETCSGGVCGGGSAVVTCVDMTGLWRVRMEPDGFPEFTEETTLRITQRNRIVHMGLVLLLYDYGGTITATGDFALAGLNIQFIFGCPLASPLTGHAEPNTFTGTGLLRHERPEACGGFTATVTGTRTL